MARSFGQERTGLDMKKNGKKIAIIGFSTNGLTVGRMLKAGLEVNGYEVRLDGKSKYISGSLTESHKEWTQSRFEDSDALIFVSACGIAVRSIAPYLKSKKEDPAVLVVDECGKAVIPILSGHFGGANELAEEAAQVLGAQPVITTATDLHSRFAVDTFAKKNKCTLYPAWAAKEVSAALLAGEPVGFYSDFKTEGDFPEGLIRVVMNDSGTFIPEDRGRTMPAIGIIVTVRSHVTPFRVTVRVIPEAVWLGVGCRRGKEAEAIKTFLDIYVTEHRIDLRSVKGISSIDRKKDEPGLIGAAEMRQLEFETFTAAELASAKGDFSPSLFVARNMGVDNVCERSAVVASHGGKLIAGKKAEYGMTCAAAVEDKILKYN